MDVGASLTERAASVTPSGWNVSSITATSSVRSTPSERSRLPGCGPCTKPAGWYEIDPTPMPEPALLMKLPAE